MNLAKWESTIQQIADASNHEQRESVKNKILTDWRVKLEGEPTSLPPFQIDEIIRQVRKRLVSVTTHARQRFVA